MGENTLSVPLGFLKPVSPCAIRIQSLGFIFLPGGLSTL